MESRADERRTQREFYRQNSSDSGLSGLVEPGDNFLFEDPEGEEGDDLFHENKDEDFPLHSTPVAEVFSSSKASMSFNNSMTEGEFGVFEYEPDRSFRRNNNNSLSEPSQWGEASKDELKGSSSLQGHERTSPSQQQPLHEPVRPPSRQLQSYGGSFRQSEPSNNAGVYGTSSSTYGGVMSHLPVSEVSVDDIRQRQLMNQQHMQLSQSSNHQRHADQQHMQISQSSNHQRHADQQHMQISQSSNHQRHADQQQQQGMARPFDSHLDQPVHQQQSQMFQPDYNMQHNSEYGNGSATFQPPRQQQQYQQQHLQQQQQSQSQHFVPGYQDVQASSHSYGMNNQGLGGSMHSMSGFQPQGLSPQPCSTIQNNMQGNNTNGQGALQRNNMYQNCDISSKPMVSNNNASFYQHQGNSISGPMMQGNVSIANGNTDNKLAYNGLGSVNKPAAPAPIQGDVAAAMSEAMEKLSDSMKRTAMSRSMVKQFSGRNIVRHSSSRGLLSKQNSIRMMGPQRGRVVVHQKSENNLMSNDMNGRASLRRTNSKHHLQHPNRLYLNDSQGSLSLSQSGHNSISFQMDGSRNIGGF